MNEMSSNPITAFQDLLHRYEQAKKISSIETGKFSALERLIIACRDNHSQLPEIAAAELADKDAEIARLRAERDTLTIAYNRAWTPKYPTLHNVLASASAALNTSPEGRKA